MWHRGPVGSDDVFIDERHAKAVEKRRPRRRADTGSSNFSGVPAPVKALVREQPVLIVETVRHDP
jgi:hypothetical protein